MKYPLILGSVAALVFFSHPAVAKSPTEIEQITKSVSVEIVSGTGSGVIVHRNGDLYTVITNRHVVCERGLCSEAGIRKSQSLKTPDGVAYKVAKSGVKLLKDSSGNVLDLAIVQFRSSRSYPVAQIADPDSLKVDDQVYTAGFPKERGWLFGNGQAQAVLNKRLTGDLGGYTVVYNAETLPGMSGGGAFDRNGHLVAVHGVGDQYAENTEATVGASNTSRNKVGSKIGYNRGIPVRWVLQSLGQMNIRVGNSQPLNQIGSAGATTADEFLITGFNRLVEPGEDFQAGRREAVTYFNRAIAINPRYAIAYFLRAYTKSNLNEFQGALADYNQAIALNSNDATAYYNRGRLKQIQLDDPQGALADYDRAIALDPNYVSAYNNRGLLKYEKLNDPQGALADFDRAIALNPKSATAYNNRGNLKDNLNDHQGALADYSKAIALDPNDADAYYNRGLLKHEKLDDPQGALADYSKAIAINPNFATAYNNRGNLKKNQLSDPQGALADYSKAIAINPKHADAFFNRGNLKQVQLNDPPGALADYDRAIAINPNFAGAYHNRGILKKSKLNDLQGAIRDFRTAARLFRANGQTANLQMAIDQLRQLGATETL
jgi:tetratricopeptide (TPR) repeat protein